MKSILCLSALLLLALFDCARADSFGTGSNVFDIEFIAIQNPGNVADTTGNPNPVGAVAYSYRIAKYEVSIDMIDKANAESAAGGVPLGITRATLSSTNRAAYSITWFEAAKFVSWLNTSTGGIAAYKFDSNGDFQLWSPADAGYNPNNPYRNTLARYYLPSDDEWYKAAYYDPNTGAYYDYPTGSDSAPTPVAEGTTDGTAVYDQSFGGGAPAAINNAGGLSPFGTMAQGGNVWEWTESSSNSVSSPRGIRGGDWKTVSSTLLSTTRLTVGPAIEGQTIGIRVASIIPEPTAVPLLTIGAWFALTAGRRK